MPVASSKERIDQITLVKGLRKLAVSRFEVDDGFYCKQLGKCESKQFLSIQEGALTPPFKWHLAMKLVVSSCAGKTGRNRAVRSIPSHPRTESSDTVV